MVAEDRRGVVKERPTQDLKLEMVGRPEMIVPAGPTPSGRLSLCYFDQLSAFPAETIFFYPYNPQKPTTKLIGALKLALAQLLVTYDVMAGRLAINLEHNKLEVDRNRKGAQFTHYTSALTIAALGNLAFPNPAFRRLIPTNFDVKFVREVPLVAIQITTFACGGYALGTMTNHALLDGPAAIEFFLNYAALCRGEKILCRPEFDRSPFKARDPPKVTCDHPEYVTLAELDKGNPFSTLETLEADYIPVEVERFKHITRVFPFTPAMIRELKRRALDGGIIERASTFEVVAAHLWKTRIRAIDSKEDGMTNLLFAVDTRKRLADPPLPKHFAGNAVMAGYARDTRKAVLEMSFVEAVQRVQEGIARFTNAYVQSVTDWGQIHNGVPTLAGGFYVTALWKLRFYDIDYGWGKPIYVTPVVDPVMESVWLISNGTQDSGINVFISFEPAQMEKFEKFVSLSLPSNVSGGALPGLSGSVDLPSH